MADQPAAIEREIDAIRDDLSDVADELDARLAAARRKLSPRYILRHHPLAVGLALTGIFAFFGVIRMLRHRHHHHHCAHCAQ